MAIIRIETESPSHAVNRISSRLRELRKSPGMTPEEAKLHNQMSVSVWTHEGLSPISYQREIVLFERVRIPLPSKRKRLHANLGYNDHHLPHD